MRVSHDFYCIEGRLGFLLCDFVSIQRQCLCRCLPQVFVPALELSIEVAAGIACPTRADAPGSMLFQGRIDHGRNSLVSAGPLTVTTAEDCVVDAVEGIGGQ